jgi:acetoin utilization protein AcuC
MNEKVIFPWHADYLKYTFPNHPFSSEKYQKLKNIIDSKKFLIDTIQILQPIEWKYLELAIDKNHLDFLSRLSDSGEGMLDPGTPVFKNMLYPTRLMAQGTYLCLKEVLMGNYIFGFNCAGGLHHATRKKAMGGCVFNDMGVAITKLRTLGFLQKIAILDFDYHPHNGTVSYFANDGSVFTASIHDSGWFNNDDYELGWGKGLNTVFSKGIKKSISGEEYLRIVKEEMFPVVEKFHPDLIIMLNGVDPHIEDPVVSKYLTRTISLTDQHFYQLADMVGDFVKRICHRKLVILGAGGYGSDITANMWAQTLEIMQQKLLSLNK